MTVLTHAIVQTAVVVRSRSEAAARLADLFAAVPIEHDVSPEQAKADGTVFAFGNHTYFEVLDPISEQHTRHRFLQKHGPGLFMLSCAMAPQDPDAVTAHFAREGVRPVLQGPWGWNHIHRWHLHPKDCGGLLILTSQMKDTTDNSCWAGTRFAQDIPHNTRFLAEICGLVARTADPAAEGAVLGKVGFAMTALGDGQFGWHGPTGTLFELWPADAWPGDPVDSRRDYAVAVKAANRDRLIERTRKLGLEFNHRLSHGRLLSTIDPVLGCRFLLLAD